MATDSLSPPEPAVNTFALPTSWEVLPYGDHWSFAYTTERGEREDYDLRIEFNEGVSDSEEQAVIALIESAPELLAALRDMRSRFASAIGAGGKIEGDDECLSAANAAIAKATGGQP